MSPPRYCQVRIQRRGRTCLPGRLSLHQLPEAVRQRLLGQSRVTGVCNTPTGPRVPNKLHLKITMGFDALIAATTPEAKVKALAPLLGRLEAAGQIDPGFRARALTVRATHSK